VIFRNRIGSDGIEKIFQESIRINGRDSVEQEIIGDTTVQEKNITYPVDTKLHQKIIKNAGVLLMKRELRLGKVIDV